MTDFLVGELSMADRPMYMGARVGRSEDDRLLTGRGRFVADIKLPWMAEAAIVRSPFAHALITRVDLEMARTMPGVHGVFSAADLHDVGAFPDTNAFVRPVSFFPLARKRVRYAGAPVAVVVAENRYLAEDASQAVIVEYEPLTPIVSIEGALSSLTPLYDGWADNRILEIHASDPMTDALFEQSRVVKGRYKVHRHTGVPLETRGCVAKYEDDRVTLWSATQSPHYLRTILSQMLPFNERDIRVVTPDVGGGFGVKSHMYPEDVLIPWLAVQLQRPIRWIEDRTEHFISSNHAREHIIELEGAFTEDGRLLGVRSNILGDVGSGEIWFPGTGPSVVAAGVMTGPYRVERTQASVTCAVTNKTPAGAYRGYGQPEGVFALERLMDKAGRELGIDAAEIRRRNLLRPEDLPFTTFSGYVLDSGSFLEAFNQTVLSATSAYEAAVEKHREDRNVRIGIGYATYWEGTSPSGYLNTGHWGAHESATIRMEPDGGVVVSVGVTTTGQGVETMVATLTADALGVPIDWVRVQMGDTDTCPQGQGGWGSRSTVMGGGAVLMAAARIRQKLVAIAAHLLEADPGDLRVGRGRIAVAGSDVGIPIRDLAEIATIRTHALPPAIEPGLEAAAAYQAKADHWPNDIGKFNACPTYANASHAAVVKVDIQTGLIEIIKYVATHDSGPLVNPQIVTGQIEGGIAQGIGGALLENLIYNDDGQLQSASFMDYLLPTATDVPEMVVHHRESPSPNTPMGLKGAGEGGVIGGMAAIGNAVANALSEFEVDVTEMPLSPMAVLRLIQT